MQVKEAERLLKFAIKRGEEFPPLRRWLEIQLDSNPALAAMQPAMEDQGGLTAIELVLYSNFLRYFLCCCTKRCNADYFA
jgi:hypothetical protein